MFCLQRYVFWGDYYIFESVLCFFPWVPCGRERGLQSFPPLRRHLFFMPLHVGTPFWYVRGLLLCSWWFLSFSRLRVGHSPCIGVNYFIHLVATQVYSPVSWLKLIVTS